MDPILAVAGVIGLAILIIVVMALVRGKPDYTPERTWQDKVHPDIARQEQQFREATPLRTLIERE